MTKVRPSVVAIDVMVTGYDFFNRPITQEGAGSGWIMDANGLIVTNNHVVEGAQNINIILSDGRSFTGQKVSADPVSDLAVVKIDATGLPAFKVGDSSKLQVGQPVAAIGNALGMGISMTGGWVSRIGASLTEDSGQDLYDLIETDAAINPGNSGGPLVNLAGEVIGITSAKFVDVNVEGVGYAIASNTALPIIQELINNGYVRRAYMGVSLQTVDQGIATRYDLSVNKGVLLIIVASGSPADSAGLKPGDVIVGINDKDIVTVQDVTRVLTANLIGQNVKVTYYRESNRQTTGVTPIERPR